jgi:hypothetical protein
VKDWTDLKKKFLERFFPASRAANIRKDINGIRQYDGESLYEYWERFKQLCAGCPQHGITEQQLIQNFYEGLLVVERNMVDAASGGAFMNNTLENAKKLIIDMAENTQQFGARRDISRKVNEVTISATDNVTPSTRSGRFGPRGSHSGPVEATRSQNANYLKTLQN